MGDFLTDVEGYNPSDRAASSTELGSNLEAANNILAPTPWQKSAELFLFTHNSHVLGNSQEGGQTVINSYLFTAQPSQQSA